MITITIHNIMNFKLSFENDIIKYKKYITSKLMDEIEKYKINKNKCPDCGKILSSIVNYNNHIFNKICKKMKGHQCMKCEKTFTRKHNYSEHIKNNVCGNYDEIKCEKCDKKFACRQNYNYHTSNKVCEKETIHSCLKCEKIFSSKQVLDYHINNNVCKGLIKQNNKKENIIIEDKIIEDNIQEDKLKPKIKSYKEILDQIYFEEYRKIIREKIQEELSNKKIEEIVDKPTISKYKKVKIPNIFKRQCWNHWIGEDIGKTLCPVCKLTHITQLNFSCAHILPESKGGKLDIENVRPVCFGCNSSVYTKNLTDFL